MRRTFVALLLLSLASCATKKEYVEAKHYPLPCDVTLLNGTVRLHLDIGDKTSTKDDFADQVKGFGMRWPTSSRYTLLDCKNQKPIGTAESSITKDNFYQGMFYGLRLLDVSDKNGDILITEDMSDASPARRFIFLKRMANGRYQTFYLSPAYDHIVSPGAEFEYYPPTIHLQDKIFDKIPRSITPFTTS